MRVTYVRGVIFFQVPSDWEVCLGIVRDEFFLMLPKIPGLGDSFGHSLSSQEFLSKTMEFFKSPKIIERNK